jgi:glycolate oxidase
MALEKYIYQALEDIVGPENISDSPVILASYLWKGRSAMTIGQTLPRYEAIVLPRNTAEVQSIVKTCGRHRIQFKASSTGWGPSNAPGEPRAIHMDLRRMNRVLEINEKNLYAVVEPYVIGAQLQAELMKRGFNIVLNGAGAQCSALPLAASTGHGFTSVSLGYSPKNLKAVEWVTPTGEVVNLGSAGSTGEWFCGDGPGPSLKGLIRSSTSPAGGLGVFTKASMKIYHWPGPPSFSVGGISPHYAPDEIPPGFLIRFISFASVEKLLEAARKICESEIALQLSHPISLVSANMATSNLEDLEILEKFRTQAQGPGFIVAIAANSPEEFQYKQEVLQQIIAETQGKSFGPIEDPKVGGALLWRNIRSTAAQRETSRAQGSACGTLAGHGSYTLETDFVKKVIDIKKEMRSKGLIFDDNGLDPDWDMSVWPFENGHLGYIEIHFRFARNPDTMAAIGNMWNETFKAAIEEPVGVTPNVYGDRLNDMFGPHTSNYHVWLRRVKKALDPDAAAVSSYYVTAEQ